MTPESSLEQSPQEAALRAASQAIRNAVVSHTNFGRARCELERALSCSPMALFVGTARTGKTRLVETMAAEANQRPAGAPKSYAAIVVQAPAPHRGAFSWPTLWKRVLYKLDDPLVHRKISRREKLSAVLEGSRTNNTRNTADALLDAVCSAAPDRGLRRLYLDEAAELVKSGSGRVLCDQLDVLRNLADYAGFQIVLVATSRMLRGLDASGELLGRTEEVFLRRYAARGSTRKRDLKAFARIVRRFMEFVPERARFSPTSPQLCLLNEATLGCVGHLAKWFLRALEHCVVGGDDRLQWCHFEATALSRKNFDQLARQCASDDTLMLEWTASVLDADPQECPASSAPSKSSAPASPPAARRSGVSSSRPGTPGPVRRRVA